MIVASLIYALVVAKSTSVPKLVNILLKSVMIVLNVWNSKNTNLSETGISKAQESPVDDNLTYLKIIVNSDFPNFQKWSGKQAHTPQAQICGHPKYMVSPNIRSLQIVVTW